jgi:nucleoid DNA-binding protein
MTKSELIAAIANGAAITKAEAKKVLEAYVNAVSIEIKKTDKSRLVGFGTFKVQQTLRSRKVIKTAAKKVPTAKFKKRRAGGTESTGPRKK